MQSDLPESLIDFRNPDWSATLNLSKSATNAMEAPSDCCFILDIASSFCAFVTRVMLLSYINFKELDIKT
ncbi:MAG: hypothetical protein QNJ31_00045 [Candidatus Caenarcaniphilales bacterium]|nr:hypothetical protein [Candidatus Caenarcaniphilales bacterium]